MWISVRNYHEGVSKAYVEEFLFPTGDEKSITVCGAMLVSVASANRNRFVLVYMFL